MSQVDEGLIHAWLDGQLPPDEAARVEQLVATDPAWQAAAAEARGMIAGASRILGALDDVPSVKSTSGRAVANARAGKSVRPWRSAWWMRVAASLLLVVGVAGVALWKFPAEESVRTPARSAEILAPAVVAQLPVAAKPPAPAPAVAPVQRTERREAASAKSAARADQSQSTIGSVGGVAPAGAAAPVPVSANAARPMPVVEQGAMGGGPTALASQVEVDPRLSGCWAPLDSPARAGDRANELRDRDAFVLHFIAPVVTDVVRAAVAPAAAREAAPSSLRIAPTGARVQNALSRKVNDSAFVTEWIRNNGTTHMTFTVRGDTLRGMAVFVARLVQNPSQPFTALRVMCPR